MIGKLDLLFAATESVKAARDCDRAVLPESELAAQEIGVALQLADVGREFTDMAAEYQQRGHARA